jgi:hypothetical protein
MGRPLRMKAPQVTYHITSRTNGSINSAWHLFGTFSPLMFYCDLSGYTLSNPLETSNT